MMKPSRFLTELTEDVTEPMELDEGLPHMTVGSQLPDAAKGADAPKALPPGDDD